MPIPLSIEDLLEVIKELQVANTRLMMEVEELRREVKELKNSKNSGNSHLPPSTDLKGPSRNKSLRKKSSKKSGGQFGHKGNYLKMNECPDQVVKHEPQFCMHCNTDLNCIDGELMEVRQVIDIPPIQAICIEHQVFKKICSCGHINCGNFPKGINANIQYGSHIESLVAYMHSRQFTPYKRMQEFFGNLLNLNISQGSIKNILDRFTIKALPHYIQIQQDIEQASYLGTDETGMKINGKKNWFWTWQNDSLTFIVPSQSRGYITIEQVFENGLPNAILQHDRWAAHFQCTAENHQICMAHLQRELNYLEEIYNHKWIVEFKNLIDKAIKLKSKLALKITYQKCKVRDLLEHQLDILLKQKLPDKLKKAKTLQKKLLKIREHILVFLHVPNVPPDNNGSERAIRNIKVKMKVSGQFKSASGAHSFAIIRSVIDTAIKQQKNVFQVLKNIANLCPE